MTGGNARGLGLDRDSWRLRQKGDLQGHTFGTPVTALLSSQTCAVYGISCFFSIFFFADHVRPNCVWKTPSHSCGVVSCSKNQIRLKFKCENKLRLREEHEVSKELKKDGRSLLIESGHRYNTTGQRCRSENHEQKNLGHRECAGQTWLSVGVRDCGDKIDSIDICFTDTTVYFDRLIKTTSPLAPHRGTMESITSPKGPVVEAEIKAIKKVSSACMVTNEATYSFKGNMRSIGICPWEVTPSAARHVFLIKPPSLCWQQWEQSALLRNMCSTTRVSHFSGSKQNVIDGTSSKV